MPVPGPARRFVDRFGSPGVPFLALALVVYGLALLVWASRFRGDAFEAIFDVLPARVWGSVMLASGVAGLGWRQAWSVGLVIGVAVGWSLSGVYVFAIGDASGPVGWVWPLAFALATMAGIRQKGFRGDR